MELTKYEESLLRGDYGRVAQKLMEISLKIAELNNAKRMIPIVSGHAGGIGGYREGVGTWGTVGIEILEALADAGIKFKVPFTTNTIGMDLCAWQEMGVPEDFAKIQMRVVDALKKLGAYPTYSCVPYMEENVPKFGDHVAWVETGVVQIANSYIGARSNRESELTGLAAAVTGRTPEYGYHLTENRYGDYLIKATTDLSYTDLGALGFCAAEAGAIVPVFDGVRNDLNIDEVQQLIGVLMAGPIALTHIVGVTPEAPNLKAAFGGRTPQETIGVGRRELDKAYQDLSTANSREVDLVMTGCHYCPLDKIREVARLLNNRKVHKNVALWIHTSRLIRLLAERDGVAQEMEKAGARLYCDSCVAVASMKKHYGFKVMATDSAKMAYLVKGTPFLGMETLYGPLDKCIEAAVTGKWG